MSNKIKQELERIDIPKELHERSKFGVMKVLNENFGTWNSRSVSISPLGVTLYGNGIF